MTTRVVTRNGSAARRLLHKFSHHHVAKMHVGTLAADTFTASPATKGTADGLQATCSEQRKMDVDELAAHLLQAHAIPLRRQSDRHRRSELRKKESEETTDEDPILPLTERKRGTTVNTTIEILENDLDDHAVVKARKRVVSIRAFLASKEANQGIAAAMAGCPISERKYSSTNSSVNRHF